MQNLLFRHEVRSIDDLKRAAKDSTFTGSESRLAELMFELSVSRLLQLQTRICRRRVEPFRVMSEAVKMFVPVVL